MSIDFPGIEVSAPVLSSEESAFFTVLDLQDGSVVERFEKAFYQAFVNLNSNRLVRKIWDWDEGNGRLKTRISYEDQIIFAWHSPEGELRCASAVNLNNNCSQFGSFGFKVPAHKVGRYCEVLTLFTCNIERANGIKLDRLFLRAFCIQYLRQQGYDFILATCAQRPLSTYLRWGWEVIGETTIDNEKRYFLYYDIHKNTQAL